MALTRDRARECIERGLVEARALGFNVAIAVVDDAGHLVVCDRMDGALWMTPEIARAKANAAAAFHAATRDLEERFGKRQLFAVWVGREGVSSARPIPPGPLVALSDGKVAGMQFEVEVHQNELGEWVAVAIAWGVQATGRTENEALARIMDKLAQHFKTSSRT
jgi:uncharacterized protein GlcG (DUF336 family)